MLTHSFKRSVPLSLFAGFVYLLAAHRAPAQDVIPLSNPPSAPRATKSTDSSAKTTDSNAVTTSTDALEVEILEVGRLTTFPETIERPAGKFILLIVNKSDDPAQSFQIDPATDANGGLSSNPLLRLDGSAAPAQKKRVAFLVDLPPGGFRLKSAGTGTTLCTITGK